VSICGYVYVCAYGYEHVCVCVRVCVFVCVHMCLHHMYMRWYQTHYIMRVCTLTARHHALSYLLSSSFLLCSNWLWLTRQGAHGRQSLVLTLILLFHTRLLFSTCLLLFLLGVCVCVCVCVC